MDSLKLITPRDTIYAIMITRATRPPQGSPTVASVSANASMKFLPSKAFYYCGSLSELTLPSTVTSVGEESLTGCAELENLNCESSTPPVLSSEIPEQTTIYVPSSSLDTYKNADGWTTYASRILPM